MPITKWAPNARWGWDYATGRWLGLEVEGIAPSGKHYKGTLKCDNWQQMVRRLIERGVPRAEAMRIRIEKRR